MNDIEMLASGNEERFFPMDMTKNTITEFKIEYPESRSRNAKIYGNQTNAIHIRVHIKITGTSSGSLNIPLKELRNHIYFYDSVSGKIIPNVNYSAGYYHHPTTYGPADSHSIAAFNAPGPYCIGRYFDVAQDITDENDAPEADSGVMVLDYYLQSLQNVSDTPIHLSLGACLFTAAAMAPVKYPDSKTVTSVSSGSNPPLKLTIEPTISYKEAAAWHLEPAEASPVTISTPDLSVKGMNKSNVHLFYQRYNAIYTGMSAAPVGGYHLKSAPRKTNGVALLNITSPDHNHGGTGCASALIRNDEKKYSKCINWFSSQDKVDLSIAGGTEIHSVSGSGTIRFDRQTPLFTLLPSDAGISFVCLILQVNDKDFTFSTQQQSNTAGVTFDIRDRFGHEQVVSVEFSADTGKPSVT